MLGNVSNLSTLDDNNNTTALANIYKMFAASDSEFTYNGIVSGADASASTPTKGKWWLPQNIGDPTFHQKNNDTNPHANFTSTLNGIK